MSNSRNTDGDEGKVRQNGSTTMNDELKNLCRNNVEHFAKDDDDSQAIREHFRAIIETLDNVQPYVEELKRISPQYDFDENTPGNGYRSFVSIMYSAVAYGIQLCHKICLKREKILFKVKDVRRDVETYSDLLSSLKVCLEYLKTLSEWTQNGNLFAQENHTVKDLLVASENIKQSCFYGKCLGFQFCESLRSALKFISLSMAIFSEAYYSQGSIISKATTSIWVARKFYLDPDTRARRIVNISQNAEVDFCKAFWCLSEMELMKHLPLIVTTNVAVNKIINLPPEPLGVVNLEGAEVEVPIPEAHVGKQVLNVRLISCSVRKGMNVKSSSPQPASPYLIFHCHGGGFVAQSSSSHSMYLREWSSHLKVPILSVDYNLAPAAPYPRALEDIFYAYCWILKNHDLAGWTGEKIVLAGDSAGANLNLGVMMKCIDFNVRMPDGLFAAYAPTLVDIVPSPARLLCFMDPLLPFGFMMRCLKAYACKPNGDSGSQAVAEDTEGEESFEEITESDLVELQARKSPVSSERTDDDTLTNISLSSPISDSTIREQEEDLPNDEVREVGMTTSKKCINDFLDKYVIDSETESDGTKITVLKNEKEAIEEDDIPMMESRQTLQERLVAIIGSVSSQLSSWKKRTNTPTDASLYLDAVREKSIIEEFECAVPKDPYISPYFAGESVLRKFPPVKILTVQLDPCLDDCVMFAKKLKSCGNNVSLKILEGLPHGFLNFCLISKEAHDGSKLCADCIGDLFGINPQQ